MKGLHRVRYALVALPIVAMVATGCSGGDASEAPSLAGTSWSLATYVSPDGISTPAVPDTDGAPLVFGEDSSLGGSTGCNSLMGTYAQDGSNLSITTDGMTMMACMGDLAVQEDAVLRALAQVSSFDAANGLALLSESGDVLLTYDTGITDLAGTTWQATGINNGAGGVVADDTTPGVTITFADDGTVSGSGGCNTFTAPYSTSDDDQIQIGPIAATRMACEEPVMATEQQFFAALENSTTFTVSGTSLNLRDADGATQVSFTLTS